MTKIQTLNTLSGTISIHNDFMVGSMALDKNEREPWSKPFSIGGLSFPHRLIQGPLAGISCGAFRELFSLYRRPAYCVTEMISAKDVIQKKNMDSRYLRRSPREGLLCYQLSGCDVEELKRGSELVDGLGADLIDLNIGCPKPKIRKKGAGSKLLEDPESLFKILSAMREATDLPLTAKIRTQGHTHDNAFLEAAYAIEASGVDALIVHMRHWTEDYTVGCMVEQCARLVERLSIPVIANGDIKDKASLIHCMNETNASAFMIARASIGKPWWYQQCLDEPLKISQATQLELFIKHIRALVDYTESEWLALLAGRRLLKHYLDIELDRETQEALHEIKSIEGLEKHLLATFQLASL